MLIIMVFLLTSRISYGEVTVSENSSKSDRKNQTICVNGQIYAINNIKPEVVEEPEKGFLAKRAKRMA
jgi:hypothetical protein